MTSSQNFFCKFKVKDTNVQNFTFVAYFSKELGGVNLPTFSPKSVVKKPLIPQNSVKSTQAYLNLKGCFLMNCSTVSICIDHSASSFLYSVLFEKKRSI